VPIQPGASLREAIGRGGLASLLAAGVVTFVLEASALWLGHPRWLLDQFVTYGAFYADWLVVWLLVLLAWSVLGRLWWSIGVVAALALVVAIANQAKISTREEPIYPSDVDFLTEPGFLGSMVSPVALVLAAVAVVGVVVVAAATGRRLARRYPRPTVLGAPPRNAVALVALRLVVLAVSATLLLQTTKFNEPGNIWRALYEARGDHWRYWNQKTNYRSNGFVGGFLYNMPIEAMAEPDGYDAATMHQVADRYEEVADRINRGRTGSLDDVNVVLVLSESFTDPTRLDGFELERDPIPRTRATMADTISGTMLAQLYGGGTANMEFEALTGQPIALFRPQMISPYQMLVPDHASFPSAVGAFRHEGHRPIAIHPYMVGMYKREQVYSTFGFEEFVHDTSMASQERLGDNPYIDDAAAFDEVLLQMERYDDPLFVNLVTMQNHIPVQGNYPDPLSVTGVDDDQAERIGQYARGLEHTDAALAEFLAALQQHDEKTVVLFYGDHLPGLYGSDVKDDNAGLDLYRTPFFVWSSEGNRHRTVPITSPSFFLPLVYEAGDAPVPPYLAMLDRMRRHVAALQQGRMLGPDGEELDELPPRAAALLADMRLVQYDFSIGERYAVDRMWPGADD